MSNMRRVLERQEREKKEIRCRRAEEDQEADEEEEEMVVAVCMLNESKQHHRHRALNVDRHRQSRGKNLLEVYFIPNSLYHVSHFRERYRMQPHLFQKIMHDICNYGGKICWGFGVLGLLLEEKLIAALQMLAYGASAEQVDEIARMGKSTILECLKISMRGIRKPMARDLRRLVQKVEARGFPCMIGSIDYMH
ncbi:unnamed protein product [Prunus armeniaca]